MVELSRPTNSASSRPLRASNVSRLAVAGVPSPAWEAGAAAAGAAAAGAAARWVVLMQGPSQVTVAPWGGPGRCRSRPALRDRPRGRASGGRGREVEQEVPYPDRCGPKLRELRSGPELTGRAGCRRWPCPLDRSPHDRARGCALQLLLACARSCRGLGGGSCVGATTRRATT